MQKNKCSKERLMRIASYCSILTALSLIIIKVISFFMTNSLALLSSLMDSGLDIGASVVSFIAVQQALLPPDKEHRFGHGKAEALGGIVQGFIIACSGVFLLIETVSHILHPVPLERLDVGVIVMLISIIATIVLVSFQKYVIAQTNSIAIDADSAHYTGDVMMNVGVIVSMMFSYLLGLTWVDAAFAVCVSVYLFYTVYRIFVKSSAVLMDAELSSDTRKAITKIVLNHAHIGSISDLRTRNSGLNSFVQFAVKIDSDLDLMQAHKICDELEQEVKQALPECEVFIHPEPKKEGAILCKRKNPKA